MSAFIITLRLFPLEEDEELKDQEEEAFYHTLIVNIRLTFHVFKPGTTIFSFFVLIAHLDCQFSV